jgi:ribulose-5-phosphate 4-epimerase/fuculose-1-phosphate aldolase
MALGLVTADDIMVFDAAGNAVEPRGRTADLERFTHSGIFKLHPEVNAVVLLRGNQGVQRASIGIRSVVG